MTDQTTPRGPDDLPEGIEPISIIEEMQRSYLDYAMSVIVARALPDARWPQARAPAHSLCLARERLSLEPQI
ncbi:MAG: hypothetical protein NVV73_03240 [Cellvibrionaceae bacterium]|nr:hypothetical protein [Cellvibrionaceae bacterium]